jgi:hypothetical protein
MIVAMYEADTFAAAKIDSRYDIHFYALQILGTNQRKF